MQQLDWNELKKIRRWTPLCEIPYISSRVGYKLFSLDEQAYLVAVSQNREFEVDREPYVTVIMWAESEGAARRSVLLEIERDVDRIPPVSPPVEMLLPSAALTYGELASELMHSGASGRTTEHASYRLTDGKFQELVIDTALEAGTGRFKFCFRNLRPDAWDVPYTIKYILEP
jgi:hypothetical protein